MIKIRKQETGNRKQNKKENRIEKIEYRKKIQATGNGGKYVKYVKEKNFFSCFLFPVFCFLYLMGNVGNLYGDVLDEIKKKGTLTVCADPNNLPYSSSDTKLPGIDLEVAQRLAKELGVELKVHWVNTLRNNLLLEVLDAHCDCTLGAVVDEKAMEEGVEIGKKAEFSKPYYSTGYVIVARQGSSAPKAFQELKSRKLGTEAGSLGDFLLKQQGYQRRLYGSQKAVLSGLQKGEVEFGFLWANIGWIIQQNPEYRRPDGTSLLISEGYIPPSEFRWNVAVGLRKREDNFKAAIETIILKMLKDKDIEKIVSKYGVPYYQPFE